MNLLKTLSTILTKPRTLKSSLLFALIFSLIWMYFFLLPHNISAIFMGYQNVVFDPMQHFSGFNTTDPAQHLSGWYAYVHSPWSWPLLNINLINYPQGTTIAFTDSIPLFAIIFKLFEQLFSLPSQFNFFSLWVVFCFLLQAVAVAVVLDAWKHNTLLSLLYLLVLCLSAPIMLARLYWGHESLLFQGILLFSLALYGYAYQGKKPAFIHGCFGILLIITLLVHLYLLAMIYLFYIAVLLLLWHKNRFHRFVLLQSFLIVQLGLLLAMLAFGYFHHADPAPGFGNYSMNILSPFIGGDLFFHHQALDVRGYQYQMIDATGDQYEGYAYFGLGGLLIIVLALIIQRGELKKLIHQHAYLLLMLTAGFIFAISPNVYIGHQHLFTIPFIERIHFLTLNLRSNGRFFWPAWYAIGVFAVLGLMKKPKLALIIFPIFCILQLADLRLEMHQAKSAFVNRTLPDPYIQQTDQPLLEHLFAKANIIILYPKSTCTSIGNFDTNFVVYNQLRAAKLGIPINTGYIAHYTASNCGDDANKFSQFKTQLLISPISTPSPTITKLLQTQLSTCQTVQGSYYCLLRNT